MPQTIEASSFISSLGVNVHMNFAGTAYTNVTAVENAMNYLGLNTMRDMGAQANMSAYDTLANAGFKFDFMAPGGQYQLDAGTLVSRLHSFAAAHPGSIVSLEGPNEINNWPVTYNGAGGNPGGAAYQQAFFNAASGDSLLNPIKMINLSIGSGAQSAYNGLGNMSGATDIGNVHIYMSNGNQPNVQMSTLMSYAQAVTPGLPMSITETGYPTLASDTAQGVDEHTQAVLTLNTVMDAAKMGVASTYLYELVDDPYSGGGAWNDGGLFKTDWSAKPAAAALHNLTSIITSGPGDSGATAPNYTVSGLSGYNANMTVHEANGTYDIVVWREPDVWDANSHTEINGGTQTATVQLSQAVTGYSVYDPMTGTTAVSSGGATSTIQVQVADHPVIIELHGANSGAGGAPAAPAAPSLPATTAINGTAAGEVLTGAGSNAIEAGDGADTVNGGSGFNVLYGGAGDDSISTGSGFNVVNGNVGNDTIAGHSQTGDSLFGGQGSDVIDASTSAGHNVINGNKGADTITGDNHGAILRGGQGFDVIHGGSAGDWLSGDLGQNTISGGGGADTFHAGAGHDTITDFSIAQNDHVQIDVGMQYSVSQVGADTHIALGNGGEMILQNINKDQLQSGWIFQG
jgi:Ca2+-binding RTX toxin-like protein